MAFKTIGLNIKCGACGGDMTLHTPHEHSGIEAHFTVHVNPCKGCTAKIEAFKKALKDVTNEL